MANISHDFGAQSLGPLPEGPKESQKQPATSLEGPLPDTSVSPARLERTPPATPQAVKAEVATKKAVADAAKTGFEGQKRPLPASPLEVAATKGDKAEVSRLLSSYTFTKDQLIPAKNAAKDDSIKQMIRDKIAAPPELPLEEFDDDIIIYDWADEATSAPAPAKDKEEERAPEKSLLDTFKGCSTDAERTALLRGLSSEQKSNLKDSLQQQIDGMRKKLQPDNDASTKQFADALQVKASLGRTLTELQLEGRSTAPQMTKTDLQNALNKLSSCSSKTDSFAFVKGLTKEQRKELAGYMSQQIEQLAKKSSLFSKKPEQQKNELQTLLHSLNQLSHTLENVPQKRGSVEIDQQLAKLQSNSKLAGLKAISADLASFRATVKVLENEIANLTGQNLEDEMAKKGAAERQIETTSHFISFLTENEDEVAKLYKAQSKDIEGAKNAHRSIVKDGEVSNEVFKSKASTMIDGLSDPSLKEELSALRDTIADEIRSEVAIYAQRSEYLLLAGMYSEYKVALERMGGDPRNVSFSDVKMPGALAMIKSVGSGIKTMTDSLIPSFIEAVQDKVIKKSLFKDLKLNYPQGIASDLTTAQKDENYKAFEAKFPNLDKQSLENLNAHFTALLENYKSRGGAPSQGKYFANYDAILKLIAT